jgi:hypothetical protein
MPAQAWHGVACRPAVSCGYMCPSVAHLTKLQISREHNLGEMGSNPRTMSCSNNAPVHMRGSVLSLE